MKSYYFVFISYIVLFSVLFTSDAMCKTDTGIFTTKNLNAEVQSIVKNDSQIFEQTSNNSQDKLNKRSLQATIEENYELIKKLEIPVHILYIVLGFPLLVLGYRLIKLVLVFMG